MHGYLVNKFYRPRLDADPNNYIAPSGEVFPLNQSIGKGIYLTNWGNSTGDIHIVRRREITIVLSGYLLEIKNMQQFRTQEEACRILLECIDEETGIEGISALLDRLYGSFGIFYCDSKKDLAMCITDRVASRQMWQFMNNAGWSVSTNPLAIARFHGPLKMDLGSLGGLLIYYCPVEPNKSIFSGVRAVPPGTIACFDGARNTNEYRWYRFRHKPKMGMSVSTWGKHIADRAVAVASRLVKQCKEPVVFFSGGVDSRLVSAAIKAAGGRPQLVTLGDRYNIEVRVAQVAAKVMQLPHHVILRDKHWYLRALPNATFESGGSFVWLHGHFSEAAPIIRQEFGDRPCFLGDFCEAFSKLLCSTDIRTQHVWTAAEFADRFDSLHLPLYRPSEPELSFSLLKRDAREEVMASLRTDLLERYERIRTCSNDPLIVADHFLRWECAGAAETFLMFLDLRSVAAERNLMFDKEMHELLEILPSHVRSRGNLGSFVIQKLDPRAAWVMNSNTLLPLKFPPTAHRFAKRCKPFFGTIRRYVLGHTYSTTGSWPTKAVLYSKDSLWRSYFDEIFQDTTLFDKYLFDMDSVRDCWRSVYGGNNKRANDLEKLVHIALIGKILRNRSGNIFQNMDVPIVNK